jgi:hypothetical protein
MDKKLLVAEIQKVVATFKEEAKTFDFVCLEPIHGSETSFILNVKANWLSVYSSCYEAIDLIVHRLYEILDKETLKYINRVYIVDENEELHCATDLLVEKRESLNESLLIA